MINDCFIASSDLVFQLLSYYAASPPYHSAFRLLGRSEIFRPTSSHRNFFTPPHMLSCPRITSVKLFAVSEAEPGLLKIWVMSACLWLARVTEVFSMPPWWLLSTIFSRRRHRWNRLFGLFIDALFGGRDHVDRRSNGRSRYEGVRLSSLGLRQTSSPDMYFQTEVMRQLNLGRLYFAGYEEGEYSYFNSTGRSVSLAQASCWWGWHCKGRLQIRPFVQLNTYLCLWGSMLYLLA